jgi:putative ABC transport system substrate-binding protein
MPRNRPRKPVQRLAEQRQTGKVYQIAIAHPSAPVADINQASKGSVLFPAFFEELIRLGYVEGRNLLIERYSGEGRAAHYPERCPLSGRLGAKRI